MGLLLLLAIIPYANTLLNGFVFDDNVFVLNNLYLLNFHHLREIFTGPVLTAAGPHRILNYYRPLVTLSFLLSYHFFGPVAFGFHLVSLALHAAIVCLFFFFTERLFRNRRLAFVAAVLFALHPIHSESVAWISGLTDLEVTLLLLLAFWFFHGLPRPTGKTSTWMQLAGLGSYALALLAKEQAMLFPPLAMLYEHYYRDDRKETSGLEKLRRYGAFWLLAIVYLAVRIRFLGSFAPVLYRPDLTRTEALLSGLALLGEYLGKLFWPVKLSVWYSFHKSTSPWDLHVLAGAGGLLACLAFFLALWKRERAVSFGIIWLLVMLLPVLNARWMTGSAFGDRYLYLPSIGFCWVVAWGLLSLWERASARPAVWRWALAGIGVVIAGLCTLRIVTRNRDWRSDITLYTQALEVAPDSLVIRNLLGLAHWTCGNLRAAETQWQTALQQSPTSVWDLNHLAMLYLHERRYAEAEQRVRRALEIRPDDATAHMHLAELHLVRGSTREAEQHLRTAATLAPFDVEANNRLARLFEQEGMLPEAEQHFRQALESSPNSESLTGLGDVAMRQGNMDQAEGFYRQALTLKFTNSHARFRLGAIYAQRGQTAEARREYALGLEADPFNAEARAALEKLRGP